MYVPDSSTFNRDASIWRRTQTQLHVLNRDNSENNKNNVEVDKVNIFCSAADITKKTSNKKKKYRAWKQVPTPEVVT